MVEDFKIPVLYNNQRLNFPAQLVRYAYSYKIEVDVEGTLIYFEPDEERNWRALVGYEEIVVNRNLNKELLKAIATSIEEIVK
jgi:hypothetical protein